MQLEISVKLEGVDLGSRGFRLGQHSFSPWEYETPSTMDSDTGVPAFSKKKIKRNH